MGEQTVHVLVSPDSGGTVKALGEPAAVEAVADVVNEAARLRAENEALRSVVRGVRELVGYMDDKANGLDDFGDYAAIPTQPWAELVAVLDSLDTEEADRG